MHGSLLVWIILAVVGAVLVHGDLAAAMARRGDARATLGRALASATHAKRLDASDGAPFDVLAFELVRTGALRPGDLVLCTPGDVLAVAGEVVEGVASVRPTTDGAAAAAWTSASAADHSRLTRGTVVLTGHLVVRVS